LIDEEEEEEMKRPGRRCSWTAIAKNAFMKY